MCFFFFFHLSQKRPVPGCMNYKEFQESESGPSGYPSLPSGPTASQHGRKREADRERKKDREREREGLRATTRDEKVTAEIILIPLSCASLTQAFTPIQLWPTRDQILFQAFSSAIDQVYKKYVLAKPNSGSVSQCRSIFGSADQPVEKSTLDIRNTEDFIE